MSLRGKVALIISGGKNLGVEKACHLAKEGAYLALHYDSAETKETILRMRDELQRRDPFLRASVHGGDLGSSAAVEQLFNEVLQVLSRVDIVVNAAGTILQKPVSQGSEVDYSKMFAYAVFVDEQRRQWVGRYQETLQSA